MTIAFVAFFFILIMLSAFFSSAETALLMVNRFKLSHRAKKKNKKAQILLDLLEKPEDFFATILVGNNLVNVAAATLATYLFTALFQGHRTLILVSEILVTTVIILLLGEIVPKTFAFHYAEKMAPFYAYPIYFFKMLFSPLIRIASWVSSLLVRPGQGKTQGKKELNIEEIKHFLFHETQMLQHNPETLRMVSEIIEITGKDIKTIMTPRTAMVALEESEGIEALKNIVLERKFSKIPIYKDRMDNITGIIHPYSLLPVLLEKEGRGLQLKQLATKPIFVSEYSSLHYTLAEFKRHHLNMAIVLDEYGTIIGLITLSDILRETIGDLKWGDSQNIQKMQKNIYQIRGSLPVEEINDHLEWELPERKDYTTLSGLFIYHFGKLPLEKSRIQVGRYLLIVKRMGKRKIEEVIAISHEDHSS